MSLQIFKKQIPNELLFDLLNVICIKTEKQYYFNNNSYKKGIFNNKISEFLEMCKPFYFASKQKYLERKITYNSFTTILRQICKFNKILFTSQIKYDKSQYEIVYYIYF